VVSIVAVTEPVIVSREYVQRAMAEDARRAMAEHARFATVADPRLGPRDPYHVLQLASCRNPSFALAFEDRLDSSCLGEVDVVPARVDGQEWHRVLLGCFTTPAAARELIESMKGSRLVGAAEVVADGIATTAGDDQLPALHAPAGARPAAGAPPKRYVLQIASFKDVERAHRLQLRIEAGMRPTAEVVPSHVFGKVWNRVLLGSFPEPWMAREMAHEFDDALVIDVATLQSSASPHGEAFPTSYSIQVAAFHDPDRARRLEQSLLASVDEVIEIVPVQVSGRTWNRVYVGRFASRPEAESAAEGIAPLTGTDAAVFIRPRS
jgi:cell division protein FtsN